MDRVAAELRLQASHSKIQPRHRRHRAGRSETVGEPREVLRPEAHCAKHEDRFGAFGESAEVVEAFVRVTRADHAAFGGGHGEGEERGGCAYEAGEEHGSVEQKVADA